MGLFLLAGPSLAKRGLKASQRILRNQMMFFGGEIYLFNMNLFHAILHKNIFPTTQEAYQLESV